MKEYIEREAAIKTINKLRIGLRTQGAYEFDLVAAEAKHRIESIPAADVVEVRHGRWVLFDNVISMWHVWVCSECGYRRKEGWMHTENGKKPTAQYCENCMAKMDGGMNDGKAD